MTNTLKYNLFFVLCCVFSLGNAQQIDKYKALFDISNRVGLADSTYIRLNMEIADAYLFNNPDTSRFFVKRAEARAAETNNLAALAKASNFLGIIEYSKMHYLTALEYYQKSQQLYKDAGDITGSLKAANNIGIVYTHLDEYAKAVSIYQDAYDQNFAIGKLDQAANNLYNIVVGQLELKQYDKVRENIRLLEEIKSSHPDAVDPMPLKGELYLAENKLDSAYICLEQALVQCRAQGDELFETSILLEMAQIFSRKLDYSKAEEYLALADEIITRNDFNEMKLSCLEQRAQILAETGKHTEAFNLQTRYISLKDSLEKINNFNRISELNAKYESEKRETEIARQAQLINEKQSQFVLSLIVGGAVLVMAVIIFFNLVRKRKMNSLLKNQNTEIKTQRQKIISSINYAKKIQSSILPPTELLKNLVPESFIYFKPRDIVSGDFYWYQEIDGKLYIATVDCTGHGVPGAFMSLIANAKLNKVLNEMKLRKPADILRNVHLEIMDALHQSDESSNAQDGMDISLCVIDFANQHIQFCGANTSLYFLSDDRINEFKSNPLSIGGSLYGRKFSNQENPFETIELSYKPGDKLFMFTDGFPDQLGGQENKKLNKTRFKELLQNLSKSGFQQATDVCDDFLSSWKNATPQTDDILVLGLKLK